MKKRGLILVLVAIFVLMGIVTAATSFAADGDPILTLEAEMASLDGPAYSNDYKVGNLGKCGGEYEGTVTFIDVGVPESGKYVLVVHYCSGSDDRYFDITTDGDTYKLDCPNTGGFDNVGTIAIEVELEAGGVIIFGSDWYGPDLDKIEIYSIDNAGFEDKEYTNPEEYTWENILRLDTNNGVYSLVAGCQPVISCARAETIINGQVISSDEFSKHEYVEDSEKKSITFKHKDHPMFDGEMSQVFYLKGGYITTEVSVTCYGEALSTNYISPMSTYSESINISNCAFIQMPFDNDKWIEPKFIDVKNLGYSTYGYEVGVFFNQDNSNGIVIGSVEHDVWKTGIKVNSMDGEIKGVELYGGASDSNTRDNSPHGSVSGTSIKSPLMFIGFFDDWRNGLIKYGKANTDVAPKKQSISNVPFGFNSWGALSSDVKYSEMVAVSNYIKNNLQDIWNEEEGTVYVNIDSFWDYIVKNDSSCNLTLDEALAAFVKCCKDNGQKAGIYYTPFACWLSDENEMKNTKMEGSDYTYYDAALRRADGVTLYGKLANGFALDPTHPGTIARIEDRMNYFINLGFEYIKLDFMTHGAVEGAHYDESITTGMQAYNFGMSKIHEICNGKMFVNLSIAPVFPYQYADGRRISCDAFASLDNTQHVLSYLTACFWHKEIYSYPDPDHIVVCGSSEGVARCRVTSGVISGTSFLVGDNLMNAPVGSANYKQIMKMFGNKNIVSVAKLGQAFKPFTIKSGERCANAYWCLMGDTLYFAVFNFGDSCDMTFDLSTISKSIVQNAKVTELWTNKSLSLKGNTLNIKFSNTDAAIYKISLTDVGEDSDKTPSDITGQPTDTPKTGIPSSVPTDTASNTDNSSSNTVVIAVVVVVLIAIIAGVVWLVIVKKKNNMK